jgi:hypothetical protein
MPGQFERTEPYKEGELNVTQETAEAAVEKVITPKQKEMSEMQERRLEIDGGIILFSLDQGDSISEEDRKQFPEADKVYRFSGQLKVGEALKKVDVREATNNEKKEVTFFGAINGEPVPTDIAERLFDKYSGLMQQRQLKRPQEHYRDAGAARANQERDLGVRVGEEPWAGLL